jgi:hypothetical protein
MGEVSTIGLDIAKSIFQIHGVGADGAVVIRKRRVWNFPTDLLVVLTARRRSCDEPT